MFDWLQYAIRLKYKAHILNPEEQQLIEEALAAHEDDAPFYYEALAALGRRLTALGDHLQERYDTAGEMPLNLPPLERAHE